MKYYYLVIFATSPRFHTSRRIVRTIFLRAGGAGLHVHVVGTWSTRVWYPEEFHVEVLTNLVTDLIAVAQHVDCYVNL